MILLWGLAGQKTIFWGGAGQELKSYHGGINLWAGKIHLGSCEFHLLTLTGYLSKSLSNHVNSKGPHIPYYISRQMRILIV